MSRQEEDFNYLAMGDEKSVSIELGIRGHNPGVAEEKLGSIELYKRVLNQCVEDKVIVPLVKEEILKEHKNLKWVVKTEMQIRGLAIGLQEKNEEWMKSPEADEQIKKALRKRILVNCSVGAVFSSLLIVLGCLDPSQEVIEKDVVARLQTGSMLSGTIGLGLSLAFAVSTILFPDGSQALSCTRRRATNDVLRGHIFSLFSDNNRLLDCIEARKPLEKILPEETNLNGILKIIDDYTMPSSKMDFVMN